MNKLSKEALGWDVWWEEERKNYPSDWQIARVSIENKNNYQVLIPEQGYFSAECTGRLLYLAQESAELPKTGDWVLVQVFEEEQKALILQVLPRKRSISRNAAGQKTEQQVIAANIDLALVVQGLDQNFNINRLLRNAVMVQDQGIEAIVVLNKADLVEQPQGYIEQVKSALAELNCIAISALSDPNLDQVRNLIPFGKTAVLIGSSGVGKSSLLNRLLGKEQMEIGAVRAADARGRHTTTRREMHLLPEGGLIIDNPGMREFQLWSGEEGIKSTFDRISALAQRCRFKDCQHHEEPGCAVVEALENEEISATEYENYLKLQAEEEYHRSRVDQKAYLEKKADDKRLHKQIRKINKNRFKP